MITDQERLENLRAVLIHSLNTALAELNYLTLRLRRYEAISTETTDTIAVLLQAKETVLASIKAEGKDKGTH